MYYAGHVPRLCMSNISPGLFVVLCIILCRGSNIVFACLFMGIIHFYLLHIDAHTHLNSTKKHVDNLIITNQWICAMMVINSRIICE